MNRPQLALLAAAVILTLGMLLYPPYMLELTGSHMGYHFVFQLPATVSTFGTLDAGRLVMQVGLVWGVTVVALLATKLRDS